MLSTACNLLIGSVNGGLSEWQYIEESRMMHGRQFKNNTYQRRIILRLKLSPSTPILSKSLSRVLIMLRLCVRIFILWLLIESSATRIDLQAFTGSS